MAISFRKLIKKIIADYKEHYDFPAQGESHMQDCLRSVLKPLEEASKDHDRLVRELDVLLNGAGAAKQASLCDIVSQVRKEGIRSSQYITPSQT